ncbi:MAG: hypothetical protein GC154_13640 [bacterium]|nr:hypothetical protein [bacterium]
MKSAIRPARFVLIAAALLFVLALRSNPAGAQPMRVAPSMVPSATEPQTLYVFDLEKYLNQRPDDKVWQYDVISLVSALQGLVNRQTPQLYLLYVHEKLSSHQMNVDQFWLDYLHSSKGPFAGYELVKIDDLNTLIVMFRQYFSGVVLWDPKVPSTVNVAMTVAGADGLLPIRHDTTAGSLFSQLVSSGPELPPIERLTDLFTGVGVIPLPPPYDDQNIIGITPKSDSYTWARVLYLETHKSSPQFFANFIDAADWDNRVPGVQYPDLQNCQIVNRDFYVGEKAFFTDLDPWWDEVPTDTYSSDEDRNPYKSGSDSVTFRGVMKAAYENTLGDDKLVRVGGFVPWWLKYSDYNNGKGKHGAEETAEEFISIVSAFNGVIDADSAPFGAMANASVFRHTPMPERFFQNATPPPRPMENKNYLCFVIGDFRSSALLYQTIPYLWNDPQRGLMPIAWAIAPMTSERAPHIFNYLYDTRSMNDYFIAGSGTAGLCYLNRFTSPREHSDIQEPGLPYLKKYSQDLYRRFDMSITAAADLDRDPGAQRVYFNDALQAFYRGVSPHGVATLKPFERPLSQSLTPYFQESANIQDKLLSLNGAAEQILSAAKTGEPTFHLYRFNLASPTSLYYLLQELQSRGPQYQFEAVDPVTFFYLLRQKYSGGDPEVNFALPTFITDTVPRELLPGRVYTRTLTLRNDGWDIWDPSKTPPNKRYRVTYEFVRVGTEATERGRHASFIDAVVRPSEMITLDIAIETPEDADGLYDLIFRFEQENVRTSPIEYSIQVVIGQGAASNGPSQAAP